MQSPGIYRPGVLLAGAGDLSPPEAGPVAHDWVAMSYRPGWGADPGHHRPRYTGVSELRELGRLGSVRLWASWEEVPEGVTDPRDAPCYGAAIQ